MENAQSPALPENPGVGSPMGATPGVAELMREIQAMKAQVSTLDGMVQMLRTSLNNPRVRIQNLEGVFKRVATAPSNGDDYQEGSILMYFDGSSTYRIYAKINKTWRYATLT